MENMQWEYECSHWLKWAKFISGSHRERPGRAFPEADTEAGVSMPRPTLICDLSGKARRDLNAQAVCWNVWAHQQPEPSTQLLKYGFNT